MHLGYTDRQRAFRREAREWLSAHVPGEPLASFDTEAGFEQHRQWERTLHQGRWSSLTWPVAFGGRGGDLLDWLVFEEEYWAAGAPRRVNQNGIFLLGGALLQHGTPDQQQRYLPRIAAGDEIWAQGWSEPGAGSDAAAVRCSAERDGDHYVINGHKSWVSRGVWADGLFGLFRTDPRSTRHLGLSVLLVPLDAPGITVRPIRQLNGFTGMADVHFNAVRVPVAQRLGAEGAGWQVSTSIAGLERGIMLRSPARFQEAAQALVRLYQRHRVNADADPSIRDAVVQCWMQARAYALAAYRTASELTAGQPSSADASLNKLYWSELDLRLHETALRILGERAELLPSAPDAGDVGRWLDGFLFAQAGSIYAGPNEIQRTVVAERVLGLPR